MTQSVRVRSPSSTFRRPSKRTFEMCTRGAPDASVSRSGSAAWAGTIAAPLTPTIHTCEHCAVIVG
eukprot:3904357-Prymnesium_polylepis.2